MYFDISKVKKELSWSPKFSNNEMLIESYNWYCENRDKILNNNFIGSHHQSKVNEGILSLLKWFL